MFVAIIFAYMLDPQGKLKGAARRVEILTVQLVALMIEEFEPSQLTNSVLNEIPSLY